MKSQPFYDATKSFDENYDEGPFGAFCESPASSLPKSSGSTFFGNALDVPFGIPAGPLLTGKYVEAAWRWGFSLATYKTVRGNTYPCHPYPNVIKVKSAGDIHPGDTVVGSLDMSSIDVEHDGITNSFGVPSREVSFWQNDVKSLLRNERKGNVMIMSFMGTKLETMSRDQYIEDFARTCRLAVDTGAKVLEVNFSCPNFGREGLICNDVKTSSDILEALKKAKRNLPLLVKVGYFSSQQQTDFEQLLKAIHNYADGVVAINTISAKVVDETGKQLLPGSPVRLSSGICGSTIRWAGLETAGRIMAVKKKNGWKDFVVVGVGGVTAPEDYFRYMRLGVDAVQSATGAMWKPQLAIDVRESLAKGMA